MKLRLGISAGLMGLWLMPLASHAATTASSDARSSSGSRIVLDVPRAAAAGNSLSWNTSRNQVSADIQGGSLSDLLERIAAATRWQVFVEPDTLHTVSAKFSNVPPGEALRLLLGDVNFALLPGTNGASRLFVFRTSRDNATRQVRAKAGSEPRLIPNELVVRLKPGAKIEDVAKLLGAKVVGRIDGMNAYRLRFDDASAANAAREQLVANPDVASVDSNYALDRPGGPLGGSGGAMPLQLQMRPPPDNGRVIVGLVDTVVQPLGNGLDQFLLKQVSVAGSAPLDLSSPSHGTAMAETMLRSLQEITKGSTSVQILPIDVYGGAPETSTFDVANGIIQAVNGGAKVINLSLGSAGDSPFLHDVVKEATAQNILLIGAAGNEPVTTPFYPAAYPEVKAVTAVDQGQLAPYANRGSFISLGAPGTSMIPFGNLSYGVEGTSVSSAILSGLAGGYMELNRANTSQAQNFLQGNFGVRITPAR